MLQTVPETYWGCITMLWPLDTEVAISLSVGDNMLTHIMRMTTSEADMSESRQDISTSWTVTVVLSDTGSKKATCGASWHLLWLEQTCGLLWWPAASLGPCLLCSCGLSALYEPWLEASWDWLGQTFIAFRAWQTDDDPSWGWHSSQWQVVQGWQNF